MPLAPKNTYTRGDNFLWVGEPTRRTREGITGGLQRAISPCRGPSVRHGMGVASAVPGRGGRKTGGGGEAECCSKLCVNQEHVILPPTRRPSWLSGLGVDAPLRPPGCGNFPRPQAPGLPEGARAGAAFVLFSFSLFQLYILKTELAVGKA